MSKTIQNKTSRKELQDRIKKAMSNKPTASSLWSAPPQTTPVRATMRGVVKTTKRNTVGRPKVEGKPSPASFTHGQACLMEQEARRKSLPPVNLAAPFQENYIGTFKHSGDLGDLWYSLPIIRYMGKGDIYLVADGLKSTKVDGTASGLTESLIDMAKPLLEAQTYINQCNVWNNEDVDVDIDIFRRINLYGDINLCELILQNSGVPFSSNQHPWIECRKNKVASRVFARSPRYHNPNINYKEIYNAYNTDAVFVGLPKEHVMFQERFGKIPYYPVNDFLEMAEVINGADLFIGNQSSPMAIAIGLGVNFIQEVCPNCPNCMFKRHNAKYLT